MTQKSWIILFVTNLFLSLLPLSPGTQFNGFIVLSALFLSFPLKPGQPIQKLNQDTDSDDYFENGHLNFGLLNEKKYFLLILLFTSIQFAISKFYFTDHLIKVDSDKLSQLTNLLILERPIYLILLGYIVYLLLSRFNFLFNLPSILIIFTLFNYFHTTLVEFILEFTLHLKYYEFVFPFGDLKEIMNELSKTMAVESESQKLYQESINEMVEFFSAKMSALVNVFNLVYLAILIKLFKRRVWEIFTPHFQFQWLKFSDKLIAGFLIGWIVYFVDPTTVSEQLGLAESTIASLRNAVINFAILVSGLYLIQGIGILYFLLSKIRVKMKSSPRFKLFFFLGLFGLILLQGQLFFVMLIVFTFSIGLMDQWINYRKI